MTQSKAQTRSPSNRQALSRRQILGGLATAAALVASPAHAISISFGKGSDGLLSSKTFRTLTNMIKGMKFTEEEEIQLGDQLFPRLVQGSGGLYRNPAIQQATLGIAERIIRKTERPDLPWQVVVVADNRVNAWALPGGKIAVNTGLLRYAANEDELAAVIAHEAGHIERKHAVAQIKKKSFVEGMSGIGQAALYDELNNNGAAGYAANSVIGELEGPMLRLVSSGYARAAEREADDHINRVFASNGYSVERGVGIFRTLLDILPPDTQETTSLYSTHPETKARVSRIIANQPAAEELGATDSAEETKSVSPEFAAIKKTFPTRKFYLRHNQNNAS
jgi:beta-barrel assembly-enhancing protease